jgi:hypothetical protein
LDLPRTPVPAANGLPWSFLVMDGAVDAERQRGVNAFLNRPGWNFG